MSITKSDIKTLATGKSYDRGYDCLEDGYVQNMEKRGNVITAEVEGSDYDMYRVKIELGEDEIKSTFCSCPYDWGGICKHTVATLLNYVEEPEQFIELAAPDELLFGLDEEALRKILIQLLTAHPPLIKQVEKMIPALGKSLNKTESSSKSPASSASEIKKASINTSSIKRQTQRLFRYVDHDDYYDHAFEHEISEGLNELLEQVPPLLEANDGMNALLTIDAILTPFIEESLLYDFDGMIDELSYDAIPFLTEALFMIDLPKDEKRAWEEKLENWDRTVYEYGYTDLFAAPRVALEQGWDYPPLVPILQGDENAGELWDGNPPEYADELTYARLEVLKRQGRIRECLNLAKTEGHVASYLSILVGQNRCSEAVSYAIEHSVDVEDMEGIPQVLYEKGQVDDAFKLAEHGLTLDGISRHVARWLCDKAKKESREDLALTAAQAAFEESKELKDYQVLASLSGSQWSTLKPRMLDQLESALFKDSAIAIYLHEGMHKEVIETIDSGGYWGYDLIGTVVDAVYKAFPDWAIEQCKKQAEPYMNAGKSKYYHHSVRWIEKAGKIALFAGKADVWPNYLEELIKQHTRKYTLRPQLEALRELSDTSGL